MQKAFSGQHTYDVAINPWNPNTVYAGVRGNGLYRSNDGGNTWSSMGGFILVGRTQIAIAPSLPSTIYVQISDLYAPTFAGIWKSVNAGATWTEVTPHNVWGYWQSDYNSAIAVSPTDPNRVLSGAVGLALTTNGGTSWSDALDSGTNHSQLHGDVHAITWRDGSTVAVGTDGGFAWSTDAGVTWTSDGVNTLPIALEEEMDIRPSGSDYRIAAVAEDVGFHSRANASSDWLGAGGACCDGVHVTIDPGNTNRMWATTGVPYVRRRTTDGGTTWSDVQAGLPPAEWSSMIRDDQSPPSVWIYTNGTNAVYRSTNGGDTWAKWPTANANLAGTVTWLAVSKRQAAGSTVWAVTDAIDSCQLEVYDPSTGTWNCRAFWQSFSVATRVSTHPSNADAAFVVLANGWVLKSTNRGVSWGLTGAIPPDGGTLYDVVAHPTDANLMFVGTDAGVYRYNGAGWAPWRNGFKYKQPVKSLKGVYNAGTGAFTIYAAFAGRGIFSRDGYGTD